MPYHTVLYHTTPYHTIPYHTIPYHTIPYRTTASYPILYRRITSHPTPSGFFLPLIFSGLNAGIGSSQDGEEAFGGLHVHVPPRHFGEKWQATQHTINAAQPIWRAVFSHWDLWVAAIRRAADAGILKAHLSKGVTGRASSMMPARLQGVDQWSFGALPHIQPQAQNDILEAALGMEETSRFYASVLALFSR